MSITATVLLERQPDHVTKHRRIRVLFEDDRYEYSLRRLIRTYDVTSTAQEVADAHKPQIEAELDRVLPAEFVSALIDDGDLPIETLENALAARTRLLKLPVGQRAEAVGLTQEDYDRVIAKLRVYASTPAQPRSLRQLIRAYHQA